MKPKFVVNKELNSIARSQASLLKTTTLIHITWQTVVYNTCNVAQEHFPLNSIVRAVIYIAIFYRLSLCQKLGLLDLWKKQVEFSKATVNEELVHECCHHLRVGRARIKLHQDLQVDGRQT